jgi:hypothetical protein
MSAASSSGEKSFSMLNISRISYGDFPFKIEAAFAHTRLNKGLMSM